MLEQKVQSDDQASDQSEGESLDPTITFFSIPSSAKERIKPVSFIGNVGTSSNHLKLARLSSLCNANVVIGLMSVAYPYGWPLAPLVRCAESRLVICGLNCNTPKKAAMPWTAS